MHQTVITLATPVAVMALVELAKRLGVTGAWSALVAVILGTAISVVEYTVRIPAAYLSPDGVYSAAATGIILGLTASGLYNVTSTYKAKRAAE